MVRRPLAALVVTIASAVSLTRAQTLPGLQPPSAAALKTASDLVAESERLGIEETLARSADRIDLEVVRAVGVESARLAGLRRFNDALRGYSLLRLAAERIGDPQRTVSALLGLGMVRGRMGDYAEATALMRQSLTLAERTGDRTNTEGTLNNLGIVSRLQGEYDEALAYYTRALAIARETNRPDQVARTLTNIGTVHMLRGSYREALQVLHQSLRLKEDIGLKADLPSTVLAIGLVYERMGDLDLALETDQRALRALEELGNRLAASDPLNDLARIHKTLGHHALAIEYWQRALSLAETSGGKAEIAAALQGLGTLYASRADFSKAADFLKRSLDLQESLNNRPGTAQVLLDIAEAGWLDSKPAASLEAAARAATIAAEVGDRETFWRAQLVEGRAREALGQSVTAGDKYREAIEVVEELRADAIDGEQERQRFMETRLEPFQRLTGLLITQGRAADALAVAEQAKARVMLDVLAAGRANTRLLTIEERERERQLERAATTAHARLQAETTKEKPDVSRAAELRNGFNQARAAEFQFRASLYDAHPVLRLSRGDAGTGSFQDVSAIVSDATTALIEFVVTPDNTYLFAAARAPGAAGPRLQTFTIPITQERLSADVRRFRQQLAGRDLEFQDTARALYQLLLAPAREALRGKTNLIIVPDGPLWGMPFGALQSGPKHYVIEDAAISSAPSIAVLREMRARRRRNSSPDPPTLLAFGDPASPGGAPIPETAVEVRRLRELYGPARSQVFVGEAASETRFAAASETPTVLHFATHGVIDATNPMYSYLQLARSSDADSAHDGRLEAWEIMKLNLRADVTVLAACETASGRIGDGEGVIGLSWAFFLAGSPRTVVSLWNVDAASTADLMVAFHRQLRSDLARRPGRPDVAASLRAAALSLSRDPRYRHPFYWAGFVNVGDGS